jgi:hypothetical protein
MNTIDAVRANELTKVDLELGEAEAMGFIDRDGRKVARNHDAREIISRLEAELAQRRFEYLQLKSDLRDAMSDLEKALQTIIGMLNDG